MLYSGLESPSTDAPGVQELGLRFGENFLHSMELFGSQHVSNSLSLNDSGK